MQNRDAQFDVVVIGGGPAGMMAAVCAAKKGARTAIIEKNDRFGIKLLMTGNGRCNITQNETNIAELVKKYGKNGRFLFPAFSQFDPQRLMDFFAAAGVPTKTEKDGRVFPKSDQGKDVLNALENILKENNVNIFRESSVTGFERAGDIITKVLLKKGEITASNFIIATGGKSYPGTGCSGQGYEWAKNFGHTIIEPQPSLVPIETKEKYEELQGVSVHSCEISVWQEGKKYASENGDIMFAHFGLSGPLVLNISRKVREILGKGDVFLKIDLKPYLSFEQLDDIVRAELENNSAKKFGNCFADLFSPKLLEFLLIKSNIDLDKHAAKISKKERQIFVKICKELEVTVESLFGFERAMVTIGGVSTKEIDSKTMRSKIVPNLFFAGEIIDVDGPTGGYNLQLCWSTGYAAGNAATPQR
jgi:predicted Rossmann fold flavoprotein